MEIGQNVKSMKAFTKILIDKKIPYNSYMHPSFYTIYESIKFLLRLDWKLNDDQWSKKENSFMETMANKNKGVGVTVPWISDPKEAFSELKTFKPWTSMQKISSSYLEYIESISHLNHPIIDELTSLISEMYDNSIYHGYKQNTNRLNVISSQYLVSNKHVYFSWQDFGFTIPKVILESDRYDGIRNEENAFKWAFIKGNSTKEYGGMGLSLLLESQIWNEMIILSGSMVLLRTGNSTKIFDSHFNFDGTAIWFKSNVPNFSSSKERNKEKIKEFVDEERKHVDNLREKISNSKWKEWL